MTKPVIAVIGGSGKQGGGVVDALLASGKFSVRAVSRDPAGAAAKALNRRGVEIIKGNLLDAAALRSSFEGAYGAFVVTNYWDPAQMNHETEIGAAAVRAAYSAGVKHLVWSTLPDCGKISGGRFRVPHFTDKARVDAAVEAAGFPHYTFVHAPMFFQNFLTMNAPQPLPNGGRGWAVPMDLAARVMHTGDPTEVGRAVAAAFSAGDKLPNGSHLAVCGGVYSWNDFFATLNAQGHKLQAIRVEPPEAYDTFFPGAQEMREMYQYFEQFTYFGPEHEKRTTAANALVPGGFTAFADWAQVHMRPT
jgi:uncharacterized protein YbjT (DUF2867 family)